VSISSWIRSISSISDRLPLLALKVGAVTTVKPLISKASPGFAFNYFTPLQGGNLSGNLPWILTGDQGGIYFPPR
jgi:hypothetical protein